MTWAEFLHGWLLLLSAERVTFNSKNETVKNNLSGCKIYSIFIVVMFLVLIVLLLISGAESNVYPLLLLPFTFLVFVRNIYDKTLF